MEINEIDAIGLRYLLIRSAVYYLLKNRLALPAENWTTQGFGFLRLRIDDSTRLHIWDTRLRQPGVSDIHDHAQWGFKSVIVSGSLVNTRYYLSEVDGTAHHMMTIHCGIGGGPMGQSDLVRLVARQPELYLPGDRYRQEPAEIHRTFAADGTVTLICQARSEVESARVFWPKGGAWGTAEPRIAHKSEVDDVGEFALSVFDPSAP